MAGIESIDRIGLSMEAPYGVYLNGAEVATHDSQKLAWKHYHRLCSEAMTPNERQRERDRQRTALQQPISAPRYKVMYLVNGRERQSAWLYHEAHAQAGLAMMKAKYGERNAIIYAD